MNSQTIPAIGLVELLILGFVVVFAGGFLLILGKVMLTIGFGMIGVRRRKIGMSGHLLHPNHQHCSGCGSALTTKLPVCPQCGLRIP